MSDKLVLVDTSIWIDYFRSGRSHVIEQLIDDDRVVTIDLIIGELYRGALSDKEIRFLEEYFSQILVIDTEKLTWPKIGKFCFTLSRKGFLPHLIDAQIALAAIENKLEVWSKDKHFNLIAKYTSLKLFEEGVK